MLSEDRHGADRQGVMQEIVDAAEADSVTVAWTWQNMADTIQLVFNGKLKSQARASKK